MATVLDRSGNSPARGVETHKPVPSRIAPSYNLMVNAAATGDGVDVEAGDYVWYTNGTFAGGTVALQYLDPATQTWITMKDSANADVTATANKSVGVSLAQGSRVRAAVTAGSPTAIYSTLGGLG